MRSRCVGVALAVGVVLLVGVPPAWATEPPPPPPASGASGFHALTPARIVDTSAEFEHGRRCYQGTAGRRSNGDAPARGHGRHTGERTEVGRIDSDGLE